MVKLTRNGIAYDLTKTPHTLEIIYNENNTKVEYCFSSQLCMNKFNDKLIQHRTRIKESLSNRFGLQVENNLLSDLVLYSKCESRGFFFLGHYLENIHVSVSIYRELLWGILFVKIFIFAEI